MKEMQLFIINHYGLDNQIKKLNEEMTELRFPDSEENFIEEMADVLNVIQGIVAFKGVEENIKAIQLQKLNRQLDRIKNGE